MSVAVPPWHRPSRLLHTGHPGYVTRYLVPEGSIHESKMSSTLYSPAVVSSSGKFIGSNGGGVRQEWEEITNTEHSVHMPILSLQLNTKYNTGDNVTNKERSNPMWGKLLRCLACQRIVFCKQINKVTHIQVNIWMVLISIPCHPFIGFGKVTFKISKHKQYFYKKSLIY